MTLLAIILLGIPFALFALAALTIALPLAFMWFAAPIVYAARRWRIS